ncbi:TPA: fimbria/pilus periplasmic chaperone [Escherichia coli]|uniref:fimbria/pilus periplasmic chaperone n=1 Tax=Escherichia coli TaxID=562 RepID=UPI0010CB60E6|nr:fimbria/pilus periplasmic chaperone [Escherichia coli]GCW80747.1 hypothetical protein HmCmsJML081_03487 [Escherichia coli]GDE24372.1 hypothetical protein HmCmsJML267_01231 [Escherichia coli]GDU76370.1 hypothetical protein BvCmsSIP024_00446 [Escherichia coli]HCP1874094.1 fimbria/pilus periplasmic chaperone [Escherichia coli]HDS9384812.1 fimbria/pilus periplasmic chaperone [Escherichia coli]
MILFFYRLLFLFLFCCFFAEAASVTYPYPEDTTITLTRNNKDNSIKGALRVVNPGDKAWLVQSWVEDNNQKYSIVFPSIVRLEPKSSLILTVYPKHEKNDINKWFVVKFIPSVTSKNDSLLTIPVAYKLKMLDKDRSIINNEV